MGIANIKSDMITNMKPIIASLLITALFFSCKKKEEEPSIQELLCNRSEKTWLVIDQIENGKSRLRDCERDDEWIFTKDQLRLEDGFWRCDLEDSDDNLVTGGLNYFIGGANNDQLYFSFYGFVLKAEILELTRDRFSFRFVKESEYGDGLFTEEYYYKAK